MWIAMRILAVQSGRAGSRFVPNADSANTNRPGADSCPDASDHAIAALSQELATGDLEAVTAWSSLISDSALCEESRLAGKLQRTVYTKQIPLEGTTEGCLRTEGALHGLPAA
jgi:hypothetical protein